MKLLARSFFLLMFAISASGASAAEKVTFLLPAPATLPAFAPYQLAKSKGYYAAEGLDVHFQVAKGGVDVATQVAVGNGDLGGAIGDTSIIVRSNGVKVKGVALLGGQALTQIIARKDRNIGKLADLKGKTIGVLSYQESAFYNLLGVLANAGLSRSDVNIQAVGPAGLVQLMSANKLDAICAAPDFGAAIAHNGVAVSYLSINDAFPAMAQAIVASDAMIAKNPKMVRGFVAATLHAVRDIEADPAKAAADFVAAIPQQAGKEKAVEAIMRHYVELVYPLDKGVALGAFEPKRVETVAKFYMDHKLISKPVDAVSVYTNDFVK
ncbi:MAG: ABC transporter substrate-binding protein [Rhodopseudomonas sp.]|nr:ABC transporter substrate-binding protein [Rhodopseudomonas sp.]